MSQYLAAGSFMKYIILFKRLFDFHDINPEFVYHLKKNRELIYPGEFSISGQF